MKTTANAGQVIYTNNGWDRVVAIEELVVVLEKHGRMGLVNFEMGVRLGSIRLSDDRVFRATFRFFVDGSTYEREILRRTIEEARAYALRDDVCDPESEELVALVAA